MNTTVWLITFTNSNGKQAQTVHAHNCVADFRAIDPNATAQEIDCAAVAELIEAATQAKRAYWLARNSAAGLTNYCDESASSRRCERELSEAESVWHSAGLDTALANIGSAP